MTDEPKDHTLHLLREIRAEQERLAIIEKHTGLVKA